MPTRAEDVKMRKLHGAAQSSICENVFTKITKKRAGALAMAAGMVAAATTQSALAATDTWNGAGGNANFNNPSNWVGVVLPANGDILQFTGATQLNPVNNLAAGITFGGI